MQLVQQPTTSAHVPEPGMAQVLARSALASDAHAPSLVGTASASAGAAPSASRLARDLDLAPRAALVER